MFLTYALTKKKFFHVSETCALPLFVRLRLTKGGKTIVNMSNDVVNHRISKHI